MRIKKAVLAGYNWNSILGLARALGVEGYEVGVIRIGTTSNNPLKRIGLTPEKSSKFINKYFYANVTDEKSIINILVKEFSEKEYKSVLIPVDDRCAEIIDKHMNSLRNYFYMQNVNDTQGEVVKLMDKSYQKRLAKERGLSVTNGVSVRIESGKYNIPASIQYPCFAKAEEPFPGRKRHMGKCRNQKELIKLLDEVAYVRNCNMIIEDYLDISREYCIVGVCNRKDVFIPDIIDEMIMGHGEHAGVTCFGKVLPPSSFDDAFILKLKSFLAGLGFQGLFTVDVFESNGALYFGELNLRIGGSGNAVIGAGVNIAAYTAAVLQGIEYRVDDECKQMTFISERPIVNDLITGYITINDYKRLLREADFRFVYMKEDPQPYKDFKWYVIREYARVRMHKVFKAN